MSEVLVIGGGMAGAIAALSARAKGAKVVLARRALGATALSSGAIDVASDLLAAGDLEAQRQGWMAAAEKLARARPNHPYGVLRAELPRLPEALVFAQRALEGLLAPPAETNLLLPTPIGTVKPTAMAQRAQAGADLASLPEHVAVVHFESNPHFDGYLCAKGLAEAARRIGQPLTARVVGSQLFRRVEDALKGPHELAVALDLPERLDALGDELKRKLPEGTQAVVLPPVIGRQRIDAVARLSERVGLPCFEALSAAPSVPGVRLQEALDAALTRAEVERVESEVSRTPGAPFVFGLGASRSIAPSAAVLATGKYIGGGIRRDGHFEEPLFGLPVYAGRRELRDQYIGDLLDEQVAAEQPAFRAGVRIDERLQPLGHDGRPVLPGLFAAGAVVQGYDPATDKTGLGVAIFTGYLAGELAASRGEGS